VSELATSVDDVSIVTAIIAMTHSLAIRVVAEGVETEGQVAALIKRECDEIQGYLLSRPRDAKYMEAPLRKGCLLSGEILHDAAAQRTLLLVDDEEYILTALKRLLRRESYRVLTAPSGHEGLELLAKNQVDVII